MIGAGKFRAVVDISSVKLLRESGRHLLHRLGMEFAVVSTLVPFRLHGVALLKPRFGPFRVRLEGLSHRYNWHVIHGLTIFVLFR